MQLTTTTLPISSCIRRESQSHSRKSWPELKLCIKTLKPSLKSSCGQEAEFLGILSGAGGAGDFFSFVFFFFFFWESYAEKGWYDMR